MFANYRELSRRVWSLPALLGLAALLAAAPSNAAAQTTQQKAAARRAAQSPFNLGAAANQHIAANLVECGMASTGKVCTDVFQSPTGGGGFWPSGSNNQYIFNSGVQLAGINHSDAGPWAGDTVGAYFFDARGDQEQGAPLTQIYSSLDANDLANWPQGAYANDTALFNAALIGSKNVSDQDTWVQYWDGDPNKLGHRTHPMGIKVEQRTMAFNAPAGAENILFLIYKMTNATNDPTFISANNAKFGISLPAGGFTIDSVYADLGMDPDVSPSAATTNYSTAILPFNLGLAWESTFQAPDMSPVSHSSFYAAPFIPPPGFVGVKYLRSPVNPATGKQLGLTLFTNFTNGLPGFPDPVGPKQLWRYMSGNISTAAGDQPCNVPNVKQARLCFINSSPADTRFLEASGPFSLKPGQSVTIVVAYVFGAAVGANGYVPGTNVPPGIANATPGINGQPIAQIEAMAGWKSTPASALRADGTIDESKVQVVPHSLLFNAEVAQTIFNNKFLLPRPPVQPDFTLVPGDNQVTIIWKPSVSETQGNPYFKIASDTTSPLYNPNFRNVDIQGYRIVRTTGVSGSPQVVADFSKKGTTFFDYTGEFDPNYVPETMGDYQTFAENNYGVYPVPVTLSGALVEFPAGGRIQDQATGAVVILRADTVNLPGAGVPFVYVDKTVTNGILYRYAVQAYSVNSLASGAASLSSPATVQNVVPRASGQQVTTAASVVVQVKGQTKVLDPTAANPAIDASGRFSGPMPPTNGLAAGDLTVALGQALKPGQLNLVTIDSVVPFSYGATYYLSTSVGKTTAGGGEFGTVRSEAGTSEDLLSQIFTLPADTTKVKGQFAVTPTVAGSVPIALTVGTIQSASGIADWSSANPQFFDCCGGSSNWSGKGVPTTDNGGSRWFDGANEQMADPTLGSSHGKLTGIDSIFAPMPNQHGVSNTFRRFFQADMAVMRAADVQITWSNGQVTKVQDITNDVPVPFNRAIRASYGFIPDADGNGVLNVNDTKHLDFNDLFGGWQASPIVSLVQQPVVTGVDVSGDGAADGTGFGLYIDGEVYFFRGQPPASGTWTLRSYEGDVEKGASGYTFLSAAVRNPAIPGLNAAVVVNSPATLATLTDLSNIHTVPDPYYVRSAFDLGSANKELHFVNVPAQAIIRIYTVNGTLVRMLEQNDVQGGGQVAWDLRNRTNQFVASGVYFYVVEAANGLKKVGRFTVVQFAR